MDWKVFLTTFGLLFIAELGDKTQLSVISLVSQHKKPIPIFLGAVLGLTLVTFLGVVFGQLITQFVPAAILHRIAAGVFILLGILIWFEVL